MITPKRIDVTTEELDALMGRIRAAQIDKKDIEIIEGLAETITILNNAVDEKTTSIKRLLKMIFGSKTEKKKEVLKEDKESEQPSKDSDNKDSKKLKENKSPQKGHGRNGVAAYTGAKRITIEHESLKHKDQRP